MSKFVSSRRHFLQQTGVMASASLFLPRTLWAQGPAVVVSQRERPQLQQGIQLGDVTDRRGVVWSRSDRPARMMVEYSYDRDFTNPVQVRAPLALPESDYTARVDLQGLAPGRDVFVKIQFQSLQNDRAISEAVVGSFRTAPGDARKTSTIADICFVWGGDTAGQGWGINPDFGGMRIYGTMLAENPDFFIHCGDTIYADGPIAEYQEAENGLVWRNLVTEEVAKVAESLAEFRGRYKYNLLDENLLAFNAAVPQIWQWDDHEVVNNWSDSKDLSGDDRYAEKNVPLLIARGASAFLEYAPMRPYDAREQERVYRKIPYGELLDLFVVDMRSYRGPNSANTQAEQGPETRFFGEQQLTWLKKSLLRSSAIWKVIASDMPIGLIVRDGDKFENMANGDGEALGRELEMAELLRFIKRHRIENVVWLTADVHYCAAHHYRPERAVFKHFDAFWEFVAGPLNAGSFGPNELDNTFGPEVIFAKAPPQANMSPWAGYQFYGHVAIDGYRKVMTVSLRDIDGKTVYSKELNPNLDNCGEHRRMV